MTSNGIDQSRLDEIVAKIRDSAVCAACGQEPRVPCCHCAESPRPIHSNNSMSVFVSGTENQPNSQRSQSPTFGYHVSMNIDPHVSTIHGSLWWGRCLYRNSTISSGLGILITRHPPASTEPGAEAAPCSYSPFWVSHTRKTP